MAAVAASQTAMAAVAASQTAMAAIIETPAALEAVVSSSTAMAAVAASQTAMTAVAASAVAIRATVASGTAKTAMIAQNAVLQSVADVWWETVQVGFTAVRAQKDYDVVKEANSVGENYVMFAIPGHYGSATGTTNCFHGHNGTTAGSGSGSYTNTENRLVLLGGGTFTESGDGMVRTWVFSV